jgi:hypothetical protein
MINRIKTDEELVREAARKLALACDGAEFDKACADMVEVLQYARSIEWWKQFEVSRREVEAV